jgi:two-component system alkaline phosphatase synthesis response regulator PhoP
MALRKILVVEDQAKLADLLQLQLQRIGLTSVVATTGLPALRKVREEKPDAILLDLISPDISGLEGVAKLKDEVSTRFIPILAITDMALSLKKCLEIGVDGHLVKPFSHHELKEEIEKILL